MRALVVTNMWPSAERPAHGIFVADQVDALRRAGADVDVYRFPGGSLPSYVRAAARLAARRDQRWDVVHSHFGLSAWVGRAAPAQVHAVTFHGTDLAHPRSRRLSLAALRFTDLPAAASAELAASIPGGSAERPIAVLPCGVALERFPAGDRMISRTELGLAANDLLFLLPSDPSRSEKRADRARTVADACGASLLTLGDVPPAEVERWVNAADLVLIPSEREGFGLALLEALACETPVLTTPTGIASEAVAGVGGAVAEEWDEQRWIDLARDLTSDGDAPGGRESAERWSSDACAAAVLEAWSEALSSAS